jgi:hypothetical protein
MLHQSENASDQARADLNQIQTEVQGIEVRSKMNGPPAQTGGPQIEQKRLN